MSNPIGSINAVDDILNRYTSSSKSLDNLLAQLNFNKMGQQVQGQGLIQPQGIIPMQYQPIVNPVPQVQVINAQPQQNDLMVFRGSAALEPSQPAIKVSSPEDAKIIAEVCQKYLDAKVQCNYGLLEQSLVKWKNTKTPKEYQGLMIEYLSDKAYLPTQRGLFSEVYRMDSLLTERLKIITANGIIPSDFGNIIIPGGRMRLRGVTAADKANQLLGLINNIDGLYATIEKISPNMIVSGINDVDTIFRDKYLIINITDTLSSRRILFDAIIKVIA
jgi:hypothetical protein